MSSTAFAPTTSSLIESNVVTVSEVAPGYLRVVINNPPLNLFDPVVFAGLHLLQEYVDDPGHDVKALVLESANPDFFIAHLDLASMGTVPDIPGAQNLIQNWPGFSHWLSASPVVSIAKVRGRARGIGNELLLACDLRFASRENARLGQIEVGFGLVPGGGGLEWLPQHVGRARALEIVLSADDFGADTAELYGWINRSLPDAELDAYVDQLARRIVTFDATALATTKQLLGKRLAPPTEADFKESFDTILKLASSDASKAIIARLQAKAGGSFVPKELDLPQVYGHPDEA